MDSENLKKQIEDAENDIRDFNLKNVNQEENVRQKYSIKSKHLQLVICIFGDLFGGVLTAFILNRIYCHFFTKNNFVFLLLLFGCILGGLYGFMKALLKQNHKQ